jgi:hypothetical protein
MEKFSIEPIRPSNLDLVVQLLQERNHTLPEYTRWKYGQPRDGEFCGVLATVRGEPVGCFGLVLRNLVLLECQPIRCGWFADWYVTPRLRASGLGTEMLRSLSDGCALILGHPGPESARAICLANGYRPIAFQSRRLVVLRRFAYERTRTQFVVKAVANFLLGYPRSAANRLLRLPGLNHKGTNGRCPRETAYFAGANEQCCWLLGQPVRGDVSRTGGTWRGEGLEVLYVDDWLSSSGFRRRILFTDGPEEFSAVAWKAFFRKTRDTDCLYVEQFTTNRRLDTVWAACGAWRYPDPPVLLHGHPDLIDRLLLYGCDRENWTYLAGGSSSISSEGRASARSLGKARPGGSLTLQFRTRSE